jgi:hypothetical protein
LNDDRKEHKNNSAELASFLRHLADLVENKNEVLIDFVTVAHFNDEDGDTCFTEAVGVFCPDGHLYEALEAFVEGEEARLVESQKEDVWTGYLPKGSYPFHEN